MGGQWVVILFLLFLYHSKAQDTARAQADRIVQLPGLTYEPNFRQFSGYLNASAGHYLHYWFVESQSQPSNDPIVLWLNGGPGCSSLGGFFEELGPFHNNADDGDTLYENVFSWNKKANVIFLESPVGVGFSYALDNAHHSDDNTASDNYLALKDFFENVFPVYKKREFFITGESYAGIYIPTLTWLLIQNIQSEQLDVNFKGIAIGNGILSRPAQFNSITVINYFRGFYGRDEWNQLTTACCRGYATWNCNFTSFPHNSDCYRLSADLSYGWMDNTLSDPYNVYQDCFRYKSQMLARKHLMQTFDDNNGASNYNSTDPFNGFPCYQDDVLELYLNRKEVQTAINIRDYDRHWTDCSNLNYESQATYNEVDQLLINTVNSEYYRSNSMRILIYNGDTDSVCDFLGDAWFMDKVVTALNLTVVEERKPWLFRYTNQYQATTAGYVKRFSSNVDVLTVKASGHFVPLDRPMQALQMLNNFLFNAPSYNTLLDVDLKPMALNPDYTPKPPAPCSRKQLDKIDALPGLTFPINFAQYSGYLKASETSYLHYWLVESQLNPSTDPLILWLNGGPGCSSMTGALTENGPFHVNKDGKTLFENPFAWNKFANVLYLESPRGVGFSYGTDGSTIWNDNLTMEDNYRALKDFFENVFPEFASSPFYITGESYGGVYIPMLAWRVVQGVQAQDLNINFKGIAIGNPTLNQKDLFNSVISYFHFHGVIGKNEWDELGAKCCSMVTDPVDCDFSQYVIFNAGGFPTANPAANNTYCSNLVSEYGFSYIWLRSDDPYNLYQMCYRTPKSQFIRRPKRSTHLAMDEANPRHHKHNVMADPEDRLFVNNAAMLNLNSSDPFNGFACFMDEATSSYLNTKAVRDALNIPDSVPRWSDCNLQIEFTYNNQYDDMTPFFTNIITSLLYSSNNMSILIFSGDADSVCNFLSSQWFMERVTSNLGIETLTPHSEWWFRYSDRFVRQTAGYAKRFAQRIDVLTVKGSGHYVPLDRPQYALQMIYNFVNRASSYSQESGLDITPKPLLDKYRGLSNCNAPGDPPLRDKDDVKIKSRSKRQTDDLTPRARADLITNLPGLTYVPPFRQFSGYLNASDGHYLHYWLVESQSQPSTDPVVLWLNGGPGCSSLGGFFEELGPFHHNPDNGQTLYENIYAWNKKANVIFLESPVGVGFSYDALNNATHNDDNTASDNYLALKDFFENVFPVYRTRPFWITGESYAGVYIPTLSLLLIQNIQDGLVDINFKGMAIGNGILNEYLQYNGLLMFNYFHGFIGKSEWDQLRDCCPDGVSLCNFANFTENSDCDKLATQSADGWQERTLSDVYNVYQDCYQWDAVKMAKNRIKRQKRSVDFQDNAAASNFNSTDPFNSLPCYMDTALEIYLNRKDVQDAINIRQFSGRWHDCTGLHYHRNPAYYSLTDTFVSILSQPYYTTNKMSMLIYNGDLDTVCHFIGDQWEMEEVVQRMNLTVNVPHHPWYFQATPQDRPVIAGYLKGISMNITVMTVKDSGHFVPTYTPGQALQMLNNLMFDRHYSAILDVDLTPQPLLPEYAAAPKIECSRKSADRVETLPGLTFPINFAQYSGYLKSSIFAKDVETNYLHYWLVESQRDPLTDPLILWLNGGPGCSSLGGLMTESGPFHVNQDGMTLFENPFAWNKIATILYLETPGPVGYSYQSSNCSIVRNDDQTTEATYQALRDFFDNVFPELKTRPFYIAGEGYGGVYISLLALRLFRGIRSVELPINFKGLAMGNAFVSRKDQTNSVISYLYFHGMFDTSVWQQLGQQCCPGVRDYVDCDFSQYISFNASGMPVPSGGNADCSRMVLQLSNDLVYQTENDPFNLYQDCYRLPALQRHPVRLMIIKSLDQLDRNFVDNAGAINTNSSDAFNGFRCWMDQVTEQYLNRETVRLALNISPRLPRWQGCNVNLNSAYTQQYPDLFDRFIELIRSPEYVQLGFRMLFYNGDLDTVWNFLSAQWFVERLAQNLSIPTVAPSLPWSFQYSRDFGPQNAGYVKRFGQGIDVLTIKGAGHFAPLDRPQYALQMLSNWLRGNGNYSQMLDVDVTSRPLFDKYRGAMKCIPPGFPTPVPPQDMSSTMAVTTTNPTSTATNGLTTTTTALPTSTAAGNTGQTTALTTTTTTTPATTTSATTTTSTTTTTTTTTTPKSANTMQFGLLILVIVLSLLL